MGDSLGMVKNNIVCNDIFLVTNEKSHHHTGSHRIKPMSVKKDQTSVELMAGT